MKKVLSVVLCLLVLISSVTTVLFSGVSANAEGSVFDNPDNWKRYAFNTTYVNDSNGTPADWGSVKKNVNAAYTFNGDASSIAISAKLQLSTVEFDVKANTDYELTYRFLASGAKYNSNGVDTYLVRTGIVTPDGSISWGQDGYLLYIDTVKAYSAPNGVFANRTSITTRTADWSEEGVWQEVALKFNSGNNTKLKLVVQAGADTVYVDDFFLAEKYDFESLSNWGIYNPNAVANDANYLPTATYGDGDNQLKMSWCNISTSTAEDSDSTGKSIKIYGNAFNVAANLPTLKANTKYTLSFKYKPGTTTVVAASNGAYFTSHIIKKGAEFNQWNSGPKEFVSDLGKGTETSDWKQLSVDFTTDDVSSYMLEFRFGFGGGYVLFLDEFTLTENQVTPDPGPGEDPDPTPTPTDGDYDNVASWKLYQSEYNAPVVDGNGLASYSWINNTQNTNKAYTYNNGEKSVKFYGNTQYTAVKLTNLEKGKAYKVKFMYFAPASSTVGANSKAWVNNIGILKGGTAMNANAPVEYFKKGAVFAGEAGKWHEYSINFRAETTDMYFGMGLTFASGYTLYIDDFTVTETDEDPDAPPVVPGKEPREEWVIDFETDATGKNATLSPRDRIEIVNAEGYDGKKSNMLHFKKGAYESDTTLNYSTTFATDTDAVFTMGVKPQKVYKLSFRVKANSQTLPDGATKGEWIGVYACFGKQNIVSSYQHSAKRDEWLYYEYNITTTAEQNLLSLYVNAGEYTPDMWIDDIKLVETEFEPFLGWGSEPKDEILINFDDFYVSYDIPCASIEEAPAPRDGKKSKATYLKGGDYTYNVVANYSAVTQYRDPVFTVPCKPETLYEFSYYIYVPKKTGSVGYFAVYYDWANTWVLRASGMTERDQWVKKSVRFTTKAGQTQLSFTFNGGKVIPDIYLDDICLKELKPGTLNLSSDASYSEAPYNVFENEKLTSKVTANKTTVIKLPVKKQFQYTFGITVESLKKSNSRIFLSFDGVNPMPLSDVTAPFSVITSDGVGGRFGIDFISDTSGYVYLVIENDDGALKLSDPYLFNTNSISANLPMGKAEKPEVGTLSVNANKGHLEKLVVFGSTEEEALIGDSPATGSRSVAPVLLLFFTTLISCVLLLKFKKGGEQA